MKLIPILILMMLAGCATVGREFTFSSPKEITIGKTTQTKIMQRYGTPFRVGYDSGLTQWTYAFYKYSLFDDAKTKDLIITFDHKRIVKNYTYNSSLEEDKMKIMSR